MDLQTAQTFLITAPAERNDLSGTEQDIITPSFRKDIVDVMQIDNVAVVAAKKDVLREQIQDVGDFPVFMMNAVFTVEEELSVVCLDKTAFQIAKSEIPASGGKPQAGLGYGQLQIRVIVFNKMSEIPDEILVPDFRNVADRNVDFIHKYILLF